MAVTDLRRLLASAPQLLFLFHPDRSQDKAQSSSSLEACPVSLA
jgi:hypothetical protein